TLVQAQLFPVFATQRQCSLGLSCHEAVDLETRATGLGCSFHQSERTPALHCRWQARAARLPPLPEILEGSFCLAPHCRLKVIGVLPRPISLSPEMSFTNDATPLLFRVHDSLVK